MAVKLQCVQTGVRRRDIILMEFAKVCDAKLTMREWDGESIPVIVGNTEGNEHIQMRCRAEGKPYLYIDHGYLTRGYENNVFRLCLSHFHTTDWRDFDGSIHVPKPWHKGDDVIVIPPPPYVRMIYRADNWLRDTLAILAASTKRRVIVKEKGNGVLADMLPKAHALVAYGSVAEVEAALHGVPVFTHYGPSLPIAQTDISLIETPIYPDRWKWLRALAGAELHLSQPQAAWDRIRPLLESAWLSQPTQNCKQQ